MNDEAPDDEGFEDKASDLMDTFNLERFVLAEAPIFKTAVCELQAGLKQSHWMWYVFPQLKGLGFSPTAEIYGLSSLGEARAYLRHPLLGPMLEACTKAAIHAPASSLFALFGSPDDRKFVSSMTLFERAATGIKALLFARALDRWNEGRRDERTLVMI